MDDTPASLSSIASMEELDISNLRQFTVLVIDGKSEMRATLGMTLAQLGIGELEYASRSTEALGFMRRKAYDIILCAYDLGTGFDGLYLFEEARRHGLLKASCVFIIVTSERQSTKVISAAELAPDAIILKPFTGETLYVRLIRALKKKSRLRPIDDACRSHDFLRAITLCDQVVREKGEDWLDFARMKVHLMLKVSDWTGVRDECRGLLAEHDLIWGRMALGKSLFQLRQYDEAAQIFTRVREESALVLESHDWLARTQLAQHEVDAAKATLLQASERSPYVIQRKRELGEVAIQAGDLPLAAQALGDTIKMARYSFWPQLSDYSQLADVQLAQGDIGAARITAATVGKDFHQPGEKLMASVLEAGITLKTGDKKKAAQQLESVLKAMADLPEQPPASVSLATAQACLAQGLSTKAQELTRSVLKNRHDDTQLAAQVTRMYKQNGREEEALRLIEETAADIIEINNEAVKLARSGNLAAAAERFLAATRDMPSNVQVLINAVNAVLSLVNQQGWQEEPMQRVEALLARIQRLEPDNGRGLQLAEAYRKTCRRFGVAV